MQDFLGYLYAAWCEQADPSEEERAAVTAFLESGRKTLKENQPIGTSVSEQAFALALQDGKTIPFVTHDDTDSMAEYFSIPITQAGNTSRTSPSGPQFDVTGDRKDE